MDKTFGSPLITNDGVTIAKEIDLKDKFENIGARIVKEVAIKTNDVAGDGTTTATVLAQKIIKEGIKNIASGADPIHIKKGIEKATEYAVDEIKKISTKINGKEDIARVAAISANNENVGDLIAKAMEKVSKDGVITIEESKTASTELNIVEGLEFDKGYISPYMVTDSEKMEANLDEAYILITDQKISCIQEILPLLESLIETGKKLLIICEDIEQEALSTIVLNKLRGILNVVVVKAPSYGDKKKMILEDISIITGATLISKDLDMDLKTILIADLGSARSIKVKKDSTLIIDGNGKKEDIEKRVKSLKLQIEESLSEFDIEEMEERLSKISGGVAVIGVGAATEVEMKERKLRIEDALSATKAAIEDGIVAGGGTAFIKVINNVSKKVEEERIKNSLDENEIIGMKIVLRALEEPIRQIAINAGLEPAIILQNVREKDLEIGYDMMKNEYVNMKEQGVIDPSKVSITALQNASSVAAMILTTQSVVAFEAEEEYKIDPNLSEYKEEF